MRIIASDIKQSSNNYIMNIYVALQAHLAYYCLHDLDLDGTTPKFALQVNYVVEPWLLFGPVSMLIPTDIQNRTWCMRATSRVNFPISLHKWLCLLPNSYSIEHWSKFVFSLDKINFNYFRQMIIKQNYIVYDGRQGKLSTHNIHVYEAVEKFGKIV